MSRHIQNSMLRPGLILNLFRVVADVGDRQTNSVLQLNLRSIHLMFTLEKALKRPMRYHNTRRSATNLEKCSHFEMGVLQSGPEGDSR